MFLITKYVSIIRIISEGSCDWNNAENSALHHKNKLIFFKYIKTLIIFHKIIVTVFLIK